ncbi:MAG: putative nucleotidyltransferase component of viral defense system [Pseudohongiellaceae bacterium]|jgi:predicted nucleotidyltransferase component of viral defense system
MNQNSLATSIRAKLLNTARSNKQDFNLVLTRYALERLLYRLSISQYSEQFLLKGALLFDLWFDIPHRPTRDADFLGFGSSELPQVESMFTEICEIKDADGIVFLSDTIRASEIRKESNYSGIRVTFIGLLENARIPVQVDIGFDYAVTPSPEVADYPTILSDLNSPRLRVYPRYTVVAEKLEALVSLGIANSRMKDFFDLWILAKHSEFDGKVLSQAITATFKRRSTPFPDGIPFGLTESFTKDQQKQTQWRAFLKKNGLEPIALVEVTQLLRAFFIPIFEPASDGEKFSDTWEYSQTWKNKL